MSLMTAGDLAHLRSLGVTGYTAAAIIARQHALLGEWVASATNIGSGEAVAKVEQSFVARCRAVLGDVRGIAAADVNDERTAEGAGTPTVMATGHSDDWAHEVMFDATAWFEQASDQELRALHEIGYRGDCAADAVLLFFEDCIAELAGLLEYCRRSQTRGREGVGFECEVDEDDALRWLAARRPGVLQEIRTAEGSVGGPVEHGGQRTSVSRGPL